MTSTKPPSPATSHCCATPDGGPARSLASGENVSATTAPAKPPCCGTTTKADVGAGASQSGQKPPKPWSHGSPSGTDASRRCRPGSRTGSFPRSAPGRGTNTSRQPGSTNGSATGSITSSPTCRALPTVPEPGSRSGNQPCSPMRSATLTANGWPTPESLRKPCAASWTTGPRTPQPDTT